MQEQMAKAQEEAQQEVVEATAGGGMVAVKANGAGELVEIRIDPRAIDPDDPEMLADIVLAAANEALRTAHAAVDAKLRAQMPDLGALGLPASDDRRRRHQEPARPLPCCARAFAAEAARPHRHALPPLHRALALLRARQRRCRRHRRCVAAWGATRVRPGRRRAHAARARLARQQPARLADEPRLGARGRAALHGPRCRRDAPHQRHGRDQRRRGAARALRGRRSRRAAHASSSSRYARPTSTAPRR